MSLWLLCGRLFVCSWGHLGSPRAIPSRAAGHIVMCMAKTHSAASTGWRAPRVIIAISDIHQTTVHPTTLRYAMVCPSTGKRVPPAPWTCTVGAATASAHALGVASPNGVNTGCIGIASTYGVTNISVKLRARVGTLADCTGMRITTATHVGIQGTMLCCFIRLRS